MKIELDRYFNFYTGTRQSWVEVELDKPTRLSEVLDEVGIPLAEIYLVVLNGEAVDPREAILYAQDRVKIYPPFGGG
jgi:sulfur carrier protein ThiS